MSKLKAMTRAFADQFSGPRGRILLLFGIEGLLFQFVMTMAGSGGFGTNLYATNLGATDSQIGMTLLISNLAAVVMMLPAGIIGDRTKNAKTLPIAIMLFLSVMFVLYGTVPAMGAHRMVFFFMLLPMTTGVLAIYNAIWQAFFGDVTPIRDRNQVYSFRSRFIFIIAMITPVLCGALMTAMPDSHRKLIVMRIFFYLCAAFNLLNAWVLSRIPGGERTPEQLASVPKVSPRSVARVLRELAHSKKFIRYFLPIMFMYASWHQDWSMWYIGQTQYVHMTEADLSIYSALVSVGQLIMLGFMTRMVERKGVQKTFIFPLISLVCCSLLIMISAAMPAPLRVPTFFLLGLVCCSPQSVYGLCLVQMLLDAIPEQNRSLIVSLNMMCVTLSNALMPYLGVQVYNWLGADYRAFMIFFAIGAVMRVIVVGIYLVPLLRNRRQPA